MPAVPAPLPPNERERLERLRSYEVLDTDPELSFDDLVQVASEICEVPIALVSLVDEDRQWFKARVGLDASETPRDLAFCAHAILGDQVFEVPDTQHDERFQTNPLVTSDPHIRFYAGAPLQVSDDLRLGTLCVIDRKPRKLSQAQLEALEALARQTVAQLDLRRLLAVERRARASQELLLAELQAVSELKGRLLATVSHEMRTPLTAMRGSLELVRNGTLGEVSAEAQSALEISERSTGRLIRLTNDLLDLERLGEVAQLEPREIDLVEILEAAQAQVAGLRPEVPIEVEVTAGSPRRAIADPDRVEQVAINLLANAVRFSAPGSPVVLRLRSGDELPIRIEVSDRGPGLSLEEQALVFQPFTQCGTAAQREGGAGLGLSICRSIAKLHGGRVGCESQLGEGATFFLELPGEAGPARS